jgi:ubiquinone/menaquinone biosynthesis C-methylase UbiE
MKTKWDYTELADAYLKRPDYLEAAIDKLIQTAGVKSDAHICDVGAGVAHLTLMLLNRGYKVDAVEPNDAMRSNGIKRTSGFKNITWHEGTGEQTGMPSGSFDLVTFGSSFNVTDRLVALAETKRILKNKGWFACMWNHRDITDKIQAGIEEIIKKEITDYDYGTRREDQTDVINQSDLFGPVIKIEEPVTHKITVGECVEAWRSHATLQRQARTKFESVIEKIAAFLNGLNLSEIEIPYTTRIWAAQLK